MGIQVTTQLDKMAVATLTKKNQGILLFEPDEVAPGHGLAAEQCSGEHDRGEFAAVVMPLEDGDSCSDVVYQASDKGDNEVLSHRLF